MKPVLVITAMPQESALLEAALSVGRRGRSAACEWVEGQIGGLPVVICAGGVGKLNAATATALMVERHQPRLVINTGSAGAYLASGLAVGSLVVASDEVLGDEGVIIAEGWRDLRYMGLPSLDHAGRQYYNTIPLSKHASEKAMQLADYYGVFLMRGRFVTVSTCSGTRAYGDELARRFQGIAENMEGAAVAQVCLRFGIDCLEIRGISNLVEDRDMSRWQLPRALDAAQRFVLKLLEEMDRPEVDAIPLAVPEL